ncbi:hypothetical protein D3C76_1297740 [compost metagenome]
MPLCAFFVAATIEGRNQVLGDFCRLLKNGIRGVRVDAVGQGGQARPQGRGLEHFVQHKAQVTQGGFEFWHNVNLVGTVVSRAQPNVACTTPKQQVQTCCLMQAW